MIDASRAIWRGSESRVEAARPRLPDGRAVVLHLAGVSRLTVAGQQGRVA